MAETSLTHIGVSMIGAIILAAGNSRRFGADKRKARLPNGKMVVEQTIENVLAAFADVLLVLRSDDVEFSAQIGARFPTLKRCLAPESNLGMGHSLAYGVSQIDDWQGAFVCLADMPHIRPCTYRLLQESLTDRMTIVTPSYEGRRGQPTGFGSAYFTEIETLTGDQGAKSILKQNVARIVVVESGDTGLVTDIDREADLDS